ncbi:MAG: LamG-like jellyroll fold domain-containing protein, partial [Planctomycetota bacterium]|jgi:hypothetical protein
MAAGPEPIVYYPFDELGATIVDASGNGYDGTPNGGLQFEPAGYAKGCFAFNGSDSYVELDRPVQDDFTIMAWIKTDTDGLAGNQAYQGSGLFWSDVGGVSDDFVIAVLGTKFSFFVGNPDVSVTSNGDIVTGEWIHVAAVRDTGAGVNSIYLNGTLDNSINHSNAGPVDAQPLFVIGSNTLDQRFYTGLVDEVRIYDVVLVEEEIQTAMRGIGSEVASEPAPATEQIDVPRDVVLRWTAGEFAQTHDVYFGTSFDDVNDADRANSLGVLASQGQSDTAYDPDGLLEFGQTYYWRVDEVNGAPDSTIFKGEVWFFTAEPFAYPVENIIAISNATSEPGSEPDRTVDGSGLNSDDQHSTANADMWLGVPSGADPVYIQYEFDRVYKLHEMLAWNHNSMFELLLGFGIKDVTVECSADGVDWAALADAQLAQATGKSDYAANTTVDLAGVPARFVRLTVNSAYGMTGQVGLSEVRFMFIPAHAREPQPASGAVDVNVGTDLAWRAGREAASHEVYFSTDQQAVADGTALVDAVAESRYDPGELDLGTTYYWKIDEVNEAEAISAWDGDLWAFTTQQYIVIDDMESYDDEENRIFDTWLDGFVNGSGSTVGYFEAPFAETTIVNSGRQSMPLEYDNSASPFYSEAELDLGSMNLTTNGADRLRVFVSGQAPAFYESADGTILMNAIGTDIWDSADEFRYAHKNLTGDGSMIARVDALDGSPSGWAKAGVMIRQSTAGGSTHSFMCMTGGDGNGASWQGRPTENAASVNSDATSPVAPPYWVRIDRAGDSLTGFISPDGDTWTQLGDARAIAMTDPVLIGLALTSHNSGQATSVALSNVSTTGNVTGNWDVAEIGVAQPAGNDIAPLYVALEDSNGNVATGTNPDENIVGRSGWNEWIIPFSELGGVNLSRAAILYIGVGDRDNPVADGTGLIFIDDVQVGRAATEQ